MITKLPVDENSTGSIIEEDNKMNERTGIVEMKGNPLTLVGSEIKVGDMAPMDLPFAQKRWSEEAGVKNIHLLSDHRDGKFGLSYGVMIKELRLLARTIFVIDTGGKVNYIQYVKETASEPDYDEVLGSIKELI